MANYRYIGDKGSLVDCICDILDKKEAQFYYISTMLNRTNQMFEYENLPDTIPDYMLELMLQLNGHVCITEVKGKLYALGGNFGGAPDPYFRPTLYVVANPALAFSASLSIVNYLESAMTQDVQGKCVIIKNDTNFTGMLPLYARYAAQMTENDISIRSAQINARYQVMISAGTEREIASAKAYIDGIEDGKVAVVAEQAFLEGVKAANLSTQSSNSIIQLIELQQYLKASWFNDIGLNANFNMKREYMSTEELQQSTDVLLPLIDDMLRCREVALSSVNETYGTDIKVKKNSAWNNKQTTVSAAIEQQVAEALAVKKEAELNETESEIDEEIGKEVEDDNIQD